MTGPATQPPGAPKVGVTTPPIAPTWIQLFNGARIYSGSGVPPATLGKTGDLFARKDGGGAGLTHIYFNNGGAWIGIA